MADLLKTGARPLWLERMQPQPPNSASPTPPVPLNVDIAADTAQRLEWLVQRLEHLTGRDAAVHAITEVALQRFMDRRGVPVCPPRPNFMHRFIGAVYNSRCGARLFARKL